MKGSHPIVALGFRPFYSLAAIFAVVAILSWLLSIAGVDQAGAYLQGVFWHSHEMVFGFAIAVMTGFLLTAVRNWTGLPTPVGIALTALAAVWLAGRLLIITGPPMLAAVVDVVFIPLLAVAIALPIVKSRNQRNYKIVVLLLLMAITNVIYHLAALGPLPAWLAYTTVITALDLITIVFAIVAGRVIPAFTKNAIPASEPRHAKWLEFLSFGSLALIVVMRVAGDWIAVPSMATTTIILIAAVSQAFRLAFWQPQLTARNPLLWMMPVAYSWVPIALFMRALAPYGTVSQGTWIHALTMGAISGLMLAMMMRSALGHTGRPLAASGMDMTAFLLLQLAAIVRVTAGLFGTSLYEPLVIVSGVLWMAAFGAFLARYLPMLIRPRIDGRPG
ncbi:MAG: NnrS family protein [Gammaproteobacteria bacterium]|nr:NnrS family protein [Gammaproteobacteria bacterium]MBU2676402.1 NnrS family protein [Gammaproteobacteria bacterium]NNC57504.1 NnrS family protein [Woeseiaceae bacterium]NNL50137.1 NnrS family protein [Woeseiaceae bacterium]